MLRPIIAGLSTLVGVLSGTLAVSAMSVAGTQEVTEAKPFEVQDGAYAVVLDEQIVPYTNSTVTITADSDSEIFLGTANGVDTRNYVTGVAHEEITDVSFIGTVERRFVAGQPPSVPAESRDWWTQEQTGTHVSHTFDLEAQPQVVFIAPTGDNTDLGGTTVTMSMDVKGVFGVSLLGFALTVIAFAVAIALFLWWRNDRPQAPKKKLGAGKDGAALEVPPGEVIPASQLAGRDGDDPVAVGTAWRTAHQQAAGNREADSGS